MARAMHVSLHTAAAPLQKSVTCVVWRDDIELLLNKKLVQQFMILLCTSIFMVKGTGIVGRANVNHARGYKRLMEAYATLLLGVKLKKKSK